MAGGWKGQGRGGGKLSDVSKAFTEAFMSLADWQHTEMRGHKEFLKLGGAEGES